MRIPRHRTSSYARGWRCPSANASFVTDNVDTDRPLFGLDWTRATDATDA